MSSAYGETLFLALSGRFLSVLSSAESLQRAQLLRNTARVTVDRPVESRECVLVHVCVLFYVCVCWCMCVLVHVCVGACVCVLVHEIGRAHVCTPVTLESRMP